VYKRKQEKAAYKKIIDDDDDDDVDDATGSKLSTKYAHILGFRSLFDMSISSSSSSSSYFTISSDKNVCNSMLYTRMSTPDPFFLFCKAEYDIVLHLYHHHHHHHHHHLHYVNTNTNTDTRTKYKRFQKFSIFYDISVVLITETFF